MFWVPILWSSHLQAKDSSKGHIFTRENGPFGRIFRDHRMLFGGKAGTGYRPRVAGKAQAVMGKKKSRADLAAGWSIKVANEACVSECERSRYLETYRNFNRTQDNSSRFKEKLPFWGDNVSSLDHCIGAAWNVFLWSPVWHDTSGHRLYPALSILKKMLTSSTFRRMSCSTSKFL